MQWSWKWFLIALIIFFVILVVTSLISYYTSKWIAKMVKRVQRVDNRRDLAKSPKIQEIVRVVREVSQEYKIKAPEVGVYPSQEINAFATGSAGNTLIAFSSNLVNIMSIAEIRGVVGHELSHLIHHDIARILLVQGIFDLLFFIFRFVLFFFLFYSKDEEERQKESFLSVIFKLIFFEIISAIVQLIGVLIIAWYNRKRELKADLKGAKIVGVDNMLAALQKLLELENKAWIVDGIDLTEDSRGEPNSISLLKFNPEKKKRGLLDLFRTHPYLEERIERLEKLKKEANTRGIV